MGQRPNFLFLIPDQHRGDWMPYPGNVMTELGMQPLDVRVPNLEALMARGVTFTRCISPAPVCAPARACLATGLNYARCECRDNSENTPVTRKTFYRVLRDDEDYQVGGVGKFDIHKGDAEWGIDGWHPKLEEYGFSRQYSIDNGGKSAAVSAAMRKIVDGKKTRVKNIKNARPAEPYLKFLESRGLMQVHLQDFQNRGGLFAHLITNTTPLPDDAYCDNYVGQNALDVLDRFPADAPWFLQVNFVGPHPPWDVTDRMRALVEDRVFPPPVNAEEDLVEELVDVRRNYTASIENIDRNTGLLIAEVKRRGELDNTIIIYSSDHGEMLGDKKEWGKSLPWRGSESIPLVLAGPGIQQNKISDVLVELQDIASTVVDLAGLSMPEAEDSRSLRHVLEGQDDGPHRAVQCSSLYDRRNSKSFLTVSDGRVKLVQIMDQVFLFDIKEDPWEEQDISREQPDFVQELTDKIDPNLLDAFKKRLLEHEAGQPGNDDDINAGDED